MRIKAFTLTIPARSQRTFSKRLNVACRHAAHYKDNPFAKYLDSLT